MVEVLHSGVGKLVCCGQPMELLEEKTSGEGAEKHVPVIERTDRGVRIRVGLAPHVMEEGHYIEWIEMIADGRIYRRVLKPGDEPEVEFDLKAEKVEARELCNIHGLWKSA